MACAPEAKAKSAAERDGVEIRTYSVIYKAIEDIDAARIGMLKPTEVEVQTGVAEVRDTFKVPKVGIAAGCMVQEGEISRDDQVRLVRDGIVVYEGKIASLRRYKDDRQERQGRLRVRHRPGELPGRQARRPDRGLPHRPGRPHRVDDLSPLTVATFHRVKGRHGALGLEQKMKQNQHSRRDERAGARQARQHPPLLRSPTPTSPS